MALTQISTDGIKNGTITGSDLATNVDLVDNQKIRFGTGNDLEILHNSSENHFNFSANTFFKGDSAWGVRNASNQNILQISGTNRTVDLYGGSVRVISTASAKLTVRGGIEVENSEFNMTTNGSKILDFETGGSNFVNFRHNPSDSSNSTFMKAIHGGAVELYHDADGSKKFETTSTGATVTGQIISDGLQMGDGDLAKFGSHDDLQIYHDGSHSRISEVGTGKLILETNGSEIQLNKGTTENMIKCFTDGAVELYYDNVLNLKTNADAVYVSTSADQGRLRFADTSGNIAYQITGTDAASSGESGGRMVVQDALGGMVLDFRTAGGNIFCYNTIKLNGNATADNLKLIFGAGEDLQIYHNGTNSYVRNSTGQLLVGGSGGDLVLEALGDVRTMTWEGENMIYAKRNGAVELYHNNSPKFETTADGIDVQGNITLAASNNAPKITFDENGANDPKAEIQMDQVDGSNGHLIFKTEGSGTLTERMRIASDGAIRSGTSTVIQAEKYTWFRPEGDQNTLAYFHQGATADVTGIIMRHGRGLSGFSGKMLGFLRNDGTEVGSVVIGNSSTAFNTSSDYRLKENVTSITDGVTRLKTLKPYRFNFRDDTTKPIVDGFFAHEVTAVPEAITGTKDEVDADNNPVYQSIDHSKLVPLLVAAVQEAIAKIEVLETEVAALKTS